ncbi:ATP synthase complex assembly protein atp12, partial [Nowakowskiella sp. JEL0078]
MMNPNKFRFIRTPLNFILRKKLNLSAFSIAEVSILSSLKCHNLNSRGYSVAATSQAHNSELPFKSKNELVSNHVDIRKFWKTVSIREFDGGYSVTLDGRNLRTPLGNVVWFPNNQKIMAVMVAAEWETQDKILKSNSLPL